MKAKEAFELSQRKINPLIIEAIKEAAIEGQTELCLSGIWDGEMGIEVTTKDRKWLIINGYTLSTRTTMFDLEEEEAEFVSWAQSDRLFEFAKSGYRYGKSKPLSTDDDGQSDIEKQIEAEEVAGNIKPFDSTKGTPEDFDRWVKKVEKKTRPKKP